MLDVSPPENLREDDKLPFWYVFSALTRIGAGARDLSRRNVSTAQPRPQNSQASFAYQHPYGLKSALRRSRGDHAKHIRERVRVRGNYLVEHPKCNQSRRLLSLYKEVQIANS